MDNTKNNSLLVPLAIIVAGLLVAGAVYFGGPKDPTRSLTGTQANTNNPSVIVAPVTDQDHIIGSRNAQIVVVEYSDFECPFCKTFHNTMQSIINTYDGKVAWVYRQFPIYQGANALHPRAGKESEASECAADQGGNSAFWKFVDKIFEITPSNNGLDPAELPVIAKDIGLDVTVFNSCLSSGKFTKFVEDSVVAAERAGALGTPYSVIMVNGKNVDTINGAQPFARVKLQLDSLIK